MEDMHYSHGSCHRGSLEEKGSICHLVKWQIHPFISMVTYNVLYLERIQNFEVSGGGGGWVRRKFSWLLTEKY